MGDVYTTPERRHSTGVCPRCKQNGIKESSMGISVCGQQFGTFFRIRGLLQWLGLWKYVVAAVTALMSLSLAKWAYIRGLTAPETAFIGIASFVLLIVAVAVVFNLLRPQAPSNADEKPVSLKQRTLQLVDDLFTLLRGQGPELLVPCQVRAA